MIYLDNAATSWPKPPEVLQAMASMIETAGGNPGRAGHRLSLAAGRVVYETREAIAELFGSSDPLRVIFALNATHALNTALRGLLRPGDRVVTTSIEHNSVMRPLHALAKTGVRVETIACGADCLPLPGAIEKTIVPGTRLVVATHASNVSGALMPIAEIAAHAHRAGALLLVDAAQSAGCMPIDMEELGIDLLAFSGHKGLLGPTGTGGLILGQNVPVETMEPMTYGGTGSHSDSHEQPAALPDKFESGTLNSVGLAGLGASVRYLLTRGVDGICLEEKRLTARLVSDLRDIRGVTVHGPTSAEQRLAVVSFTVAGRSTSELAERLEEEYGILCRVGLHCAPSAHRCMGTFPHGTIRFAPGPFTRDEEISAAVDAVARIT
ncbi:MAG TPA: aminotransferase class V-fold PLP-dependent enzyme [Planctomycetota bacterium]|jgi:cysteine desulfurase family protein